MRRTEVLPMSRRRESADFLANGLDRHNRMITSSIMRFKQNILKMIRNGCSS
jgi:hypothetical protein